MRGVEDNHRGHDANRRSQGSEALHELPMPLTRDEIAEVLSAGTFGFGGELESRYGVASASSW